MSVYQKMKAAGVEVDNHESDLYVPVTDISKEIVRACKLKAETFVSERDCALWYDIPFAYDPFFQKRTHDMTKEHLENCQCVRCKPMDRPCGCDHCINYRLTKG